MKTNYFKKLIARVKTNKIIVTLIGRRLLGAAVVICITHAAAAQQEPKKTHMGIAVLLQVNANGYGSSYLPGLYFSKNRSTLNLSPVIQNRNLNLAGLQLGYAYTIAGEAVDGLRGPELYLFVNGAYNNNALMGKAALQNEYTANRLSSEAQVTNLRFQSAELFGGVGLKLNLIRNLKWTSSVGLGGNTSFNFPHYNEMYYSANNFGLNLSTGLTYNLR